MSDQTKTKAQLLAELNDLRQRVAQLQAAAPPQVETSLPTDITARKQAEAALQVSEQKFWQVIEYSSDAVVVADETGRIVEWNPAAEQLTGLTRATVLGRTGWEVQFDLIPVERQTPDVYEQLKSRTQVILQIGQSQRLGQTVEIEIQRKDGSYRDIQAVDFAVKTEMGIGRGSVIRDVTERKQVERIEAAQLAVSRVLAASPEPAVALKQVLEAIAGCLGWQLAELWWRNGDDLSLRLVWQDGWYTLDRHELAEFEQASQGYTFRPGEGLTGKVWQTGRAIWDKDLRLPQRPRAALAAAVEFHSAVGIPIIRDSETLGVMTFFSRSARPLEERLLAALTDLGRQIGQFLARRQAEAALQESQARLELIVAAAELGLWDTHIPSGETVYNKQWAEILGYTLAELKPRLNSWKELVHPEDLVKVREVLQAHLFGDTPHFQIEHRMRTKSGEWKWILSTGNVIARDERDRPVRVVGIHLDITARKAAEENLHRYQQMVSTSPDWLSLVDRDYVYRIVNQTYLSVNNKSYEEIIGHPVAELLGEAKFVEVVKPYLDQALAGETVHYQEWFAFPAQGQRFNDVTYAPYREADGTISGVIVSGRDVTDTKLLEEHLHQAQKMETVGQLAAGMAHHYNNLLTSIIGFTSLSLRTLPPGDPLARNLNQISRTAERMAVLVRQLLAFARKQLLQPKTVSLNELVLKFQPELDQLVLTPVELAVHLAPEVGQVEVDPHSFKDLLLALVSNAIDAMPQGGRLTLTTANASLGAVEAGWYGLPPGDYVLLTVKDTGIGLTDEVKAHLFEPFFTTKRVGQGVGLGLAMALGIAKQHGGHLLAESQPGQGSTFMLYLPHLASPPSQPPTPDRSPAAGTILLIETEPMVRKFVTQVLTQEGYTVLSAASKEAVLQLMTGPSKPSPQLLLISARRSSPILIQRLRTNFPTLKVILFIDELADLSSEMKGTQVDFLLKPYGPSNLIQKVHAILGPVSP